MMNDPYNVIGDKFTKEVKKLQYDLNASRISRESYDRRVESLERWKMLKLFEVRMAEERARNNYLRQNLNM